MVRGCRPHFALPPAALALCLAYLPPIVNAQDKLTVNVPSEVTLCIPFNLTWSGGTPPYRLDIQPFANGSPLADGTANLRMIGIQNTWVLFIPDFPPGSTLQITVTNESSDAGGFATEVPSSDSSCLSATTSSSTTSPTPSPSTSSSPSATSSSSPAVLASSGDGLSKEAIVGIAIATVVIGVGLIALAAWSLLRRRKRVRQPEKGHDRSIVSPTFSDDAPTNPYTGLSSTLASTSADPRPPASTTSLSQLGGAGGKKRVRELSDPTSLSTNVTDLRAADTSAAPLSAAGGGGRGGVLPFDPDGTARLSAVEGGLGRAFSDVGASDVASSSGKATLPPPFAQVLFQGRVVE